MRSKIQGTKEKRVFVKSYPEFLYVEKAVKILKHNKGNNLQVSILGTFAEESIDDEKNLVNEKDVMEKRCKTLFGFPIDFGTLSNPEIGTIFISGFLVHTFLQKVERKTIGSMSTGPYGILRGLGIDRERTAFYIKALQQGNYLLILRGFENELNQLEDNLKELT